jgi:hypothetical protein
MLARLVAAIAFLAVASSSVLTAQSHAVGGHSSYVLKSYTPGIAQPIRIGRYTFTVVEDPAAEVETQLHAFIQGPNDQKPRQFYSYGRDIGIAVVPECHLAVVDDTLTTKLAKSVAISLPDLKRTNLSDDAVAQYRQTYHASPTMFINAFAEAVSHDCKQVLVTVKLTYGDARTPEEAESEGKRFPKRGYEVSSTTGKVVRVLPAEETGLE